jgi:hypothetical protein
MLGFFEFVRYGNFILDYANGTNSLSLVDVSRRRVA